MSSGISTIIFTAPTLFDQKTGMITPSFKHQMDLVGLIAKQFFAEYPAEHVINVNELLQTNGCFQRYVDFYKHGLTSNFMITYEQAVAFLDDNYKSLNRVSNPRLNRLPTPRDWKVEMKQFGYMQALKSEEKATIAWASSAWNSKARQVNAEMRAYKTTRAT